MSQDTVDHPDEEEISRTSTGSPKIRRKKKPRQPRTVINPYGNVYFYWLCILTISVLYNLWTVIVRQAFPELQRRPQTLWYILDGFTDLTYIVDIIVQFRTGYLEQGLIVYDDRKLANHYLHSKCFIFDLFTVFPLDFLQISFGMNPILRFPRFVKVYRVYNYYYMVESRTLYPNFWRVLNLVHILLLLAHWFGCFYYMLSEAEHFKGDWCYPNRYGKEFETLTRKYLGSVYWSTLTLTTIGDLPTPESNRQNRPTILNITEERDASENSTELSFKSTDATNSSVNSLNAQEYYSTQITPTYLPFDYGHTIELDGTPVQHLNNNINDSGELKQVFYLYKTNSAPVLKVHQTGPPLPRLLNLRMERRNHLSSIYFFPEKGSIWGSSSEIFRKVSHSLKLHRSRDNSHRKKRSSPISPAILVPRANQELEKYNKRLKTFEISSAKPIYNKVSEASLLWSRTLHVPSSFSSTFSPTKHHRKQKLQKTIIEQEKDLSQPPSRLRNERDVSKVNDPSTSDARLGYVITLNINNFHDKNATVKMVRRMWYPPSRWNFFSLQPSDPSLQSLENCSSWYDCDISSSIFSERNRGTKKMVGLTRRGFRSRLLLIRTNEGFIFTIISYLIGVFIFATIVGQVGNVITNRNANRLEFERLLDGAKLYMRHHKVPREMQRRVQRWYDYSWSRGRIQGGGDINSALGLLPDKLRTELALHVNLSTLKKVSIFKECQPEFLHDLVLKMKAYIFTPGDLICRKGEVAREMFIIADGILEVISDVGKVLTTMKAGDFFGEIGILNLDGLNKRTADVRSVGYSELFSLSREDVLAAMKDYPEAQEILQSLGHKRLKEARHQTCKPDSEPSSKRVSLSPSKGESGDDKQTKKIVSRIRSDVSAIRNAFRKSKGITRDTETVELEPLTYEKRKFGSADEGVPSMKRILKKLGRTGGSNSSDNFGSVSRGVLKRMSNVTSDDPQVQNKAQDEQSFLSAGLPLLRLKRSKEKEDKKDKLQEADGKTKRTGSKISRESISSVKEESKRDEDEQKVGEETNEPEVIGAGLPFLARIRLLAEKEKREKEKAENEKKTSESEPKEAIILKIEAKDPPIKSESVFKSKLKSVMQQPKDPPGKKLTIITQTSTVDKEKINDLNKGTTIEECNSVLNNNVPKPSDSSEKRNDQEIKNSLDTVGNNENPISSYASDAKTIATRSDSENNTTNNSISSELDPSKEKMQRSESFRKAIHDGIIESSEKEGEFNIHKTESESKKDMKEENTTSLTCNKVSDTCRNIKEAQSPNTKHALAVSKLNNLEKEKNKQDGIIDVSKKIDSSPEDNTKPTSGSTLKVPSSEISPPLSSPESTETPERKTLKSILKRISREDSACNLLLPPEGADLRRLMKAQTIQGFVARRSKLSKTVSFQRKTLSSPPSATILDILSSTSPSKRKQQSSVSFDDSYSSGIHTMKTPQRSSTYSQSPLRKQTTRSSEGVQRLLTKHTSIGLETIQASQAEDLVRGVRKILRDKIEDVQVAWEARIEALQREVAARDETIQRLSETIARLQTSSQGSANGNKGNEMDRRQILEHNGLNPNDEHTVRQSPGPFAIQLSETSNPSSDEDEPLFMRCNSIESIIHHSPSMSPDGEGLLETESTRSRAVRPLIQKQNSLYLARIPRSSFDSEDDSRSGRHEVIIDMGGSSTDEEIYSFSSDDDHLILTNSSHSEVLPETHFLAIDDTSESFEEEEEEDYPCEGNEEDEESVITTKKGRSHEDEEELTSQDWEVQMLAKQLAQDQRGVARKIDRDIACGKLQSPLAELHEALATDNLNNLTELDLLRLEKIVRKERERLRQYARMYSLDERPVLEDEFTSLYRSRSQLLVSKSSELCRAGPAQRRLSTLLKQLTTLPPSEQFLLDRLVYKSSKSRLLSRQQSLCDDRLASYDVDRSFLLSNSTAAHIRRAHSVCSPPPDLQPFFGQSSLLSSSPSSSSSSSLPGRQREPQRVHSIGEESCVLMEEDYHPSATDRSPSTLDSIYQSSVVYGDRKSEEGRELSPDKEAIPLLRPPR